MAKSGIGGGGGVGAAQSAGEIRGKQRKSRKRRTAAQRRALSIPKDETVTKAVRKKY